MTVDFETMTVFRRVGCKLLYDHLAELYIHKLNICTCILCCYVYYNYTQRLPRLCSASAQSFSGSTCRRSPGPARQCQYKRCRKPHSGHGRESTLGKEDGQEPVSLIPATYIEARLTRTQQSYLYLSHGQPHDTLHTETQRAQAETFHKVRPSEC